MKKLSILTILLISQFSGAVFADGCTEGDCVNGQGTFTYTNGSRYVGEFKDGKKYGQGTFTYVDGRTRTGTWFANKYLGIPEEAEAYDKQQQKDREQREIQRAKKVIGVKYWRSFHSEMSPQDVVDEWNRLGIFKKEARVNKMPKKPQYTTKGYNWIPVNTKARINLRKSGGEYAMNFDGFWFQQPYFAFDKNDKLSEISFMLWNVKIPNPFNSLTKSCGGGIARNYHHLDGSEAAFRTLSNALENKYNSLARTFNYGKGETSVHYLSDNKTAVWLSMEIHRTERFCAKIKLHYSDYQRNQRLIELAEKRKSDKAKDIF